MPRARKWLTGVGLALLLIGAVVGNLLVCASVHDEAPAVHASERSGNGVVATTHASVSLEDLRRTEPVGTLRLEGQVIDEQEQPVASADVIVTPGDVRVTSSSDGSFVVEGLTSRQYRVSARKDELYADSTSTRLTASSEPVILRMRTGAALLVHVVDDARAPVAGAKVVLDQAFTATSDATGNARLPGLGSHFHLVEVTAANMARARISLMLGHDPSGTIERTVTLHRGASVSGIVVGPDDRPVADATIEIEMIGDRWAARATSDSSGAWHVAAIGAGKYLVRATSKTYGPASDISLTLDGATPRRDILVKLAFDAQLVGTVVDVNGAPIAAAVVTAGTSITQSYSALTDSSGRFELLGIKAGTYNVLAQSGSRASASTRTTIANDQRVDTKLVVEEASIAGIVVDRDGHPVGEARVSAIPTGHIESRANFGDDVTDSRGRFDLGGLEPGQYRVSATWAGQEERRLDGGELVKTGDRNVKLVLAKPATLTGRVLLDGAPMPYYGMLVTEHPEFPFIGIPNAVRSIDGRFTVRAISPGRWGVVLLGPGTARKTISNVNVEDSKATDLGDIAMAHGQHVSGHVRDSSGAAVAGATVTIGHVMPVHNDEPLEAWFRGTFQTTTNDAGAYSFDGIAPLGGRSEEVFATRSDLGSSLAANLHDGDAVVDLVIVASGGIDGVVEHFTESVGRVRARRTGDAAGAHSASVDATGAFRFDGLPAGDYTLSMIPLPGKTAPTEVTVTVAADRRAQARLVVPTSTVMLTVRVTGGSCTGVMLGSGSGSGSGFAVGEAHALCSAGVAEFDAVQPGAYRACPDGQHCVSITVTATPDKQVVEVRVP
jgi:hypothetical protein